MISFGAPPFMILEIKSPHFRSWWSFDCSCSWRTWFFWLSISNWEFSSVTRRSSHWSIIVCASENVLLTWRRAVNSQLIYSFSRSFRNSTWSTNWSSKDVPDRCWVKKQDFDSSKARRPVNLPLAISLISPMQRVFSVNNCSFLLVETWLKSADSELFTKINRHHVLL